MFGFFKNKSLDEEVAIRIQIAQSAAMSYVIFGHPDALEAFKCCFAATRLRENTEGLICTTLDQLAAHEDLSDAKMDRYQEILDHMAIGYEQFDVAFAFTNLQRSSPRLFKAIRKCDSELAERALLF